MFPEVNQKFQNYFAPAIATNSLWRLLAGLIVIAVMYLLFQFLVIGGVGVYFAVVEDLNGVAGGEGIKKKLGLFFRGLEPQGVIVILISFVGVFLGVLLTVKWVHKRELRSLFGSNFSDNLSGFINGFSILFIISVIGITLYALIDPPIENLKFSVWLKWMLLAVPLLFLQVVSEELVFRGYLQQQLAARFNSRWAWYFLPSVVFGLMHFSPDIMGANAWLVVAQTTLFGLIAAEVTARTGNLGAVIGLHFANNLFALTGVALDGSMSGIGLYRSAIHVSDFTAIRSVLVYDFIFTVLLYGLFLLWCRKRPQL